MFSLVRYTLQHKVLRSRRPAERGGFSVHTETVLWRWRMRANHTEDCCRWLERQCWDFICSVPLLFLAWPDFTFRRMETGLDCLRSAECDFSLGMRVRVLRPYLTKWPHLTKRCVVKALRPDSLISQNDHTIFLWDKVIFRPYLTKVLSCKMTLSHQIFLSDGQSWTSEKIFWVLTTFPGLPWCLHISSCLIWHTDNKQNLYDNCL